MVNGVFPIWPIVETSQFMFSKYLIDDQKVKIIKSEFKGEKIKKNKHKNNVVLKEKNKRKQEKKTLK